MPMVLTEYQPPFPYFGGKSAVADVVWRALGDVDNYIEPFFGSGAVLMLRPHEPRIETANDASGYIANFWRAVRADADKVAEYCDWPVNECDLEARHKWLVQVDRKRELPLRLKDDPEYFDAKIAGWWCWGLCQWIGAGWCSGEWHGPGSADNAGCGINVRDPKRGGKRPDLSAGRGVHRQLPHLSDAGQGVHRPGYDLVEYFRTLQARMRRVRVCCGDWLRVCKSEATTTKHGLTGIFLDPPYPASAGRAGDIYEVEDLEVGHAVRDWAIENGRRPNLRIVLAGYEGQHEMPDDWRVHAWSTSGGMAKTSSDPDSQGKRNRHRERLWLSPHCDRELDLFSGLCEDVE